jgi:hypothetical protein
VERLIAFKTCAMAVCSHPGHEVARRQMSNGSGMLAFGLHDGFEGAAEDGQAAPDHASGDAEELRRLDAALRPLWDLFRAAIVLANIGCPFHGAAAMQRI